MSTEPLRVLCVFSSLERGGAESMCMSLYRRIDRNKVQFDFVKHSPPRGAFEDEIESLGGRIYNAPRYRLYNRRSYLRWWHRFFQEHPEYKIIHGHFFTISNLYFQVAKKYGLITVAHSHCTRGIPDEYPGARLKQKIENHMLAQLDNCSDYRFACSQEAGEWIFKKPFSILRNAIDTKDFVFDPAVRAQTRKEFGIAEDELVLGTVGRIVHQKNPAGICDIFAEVHKRNPKTRLLWVGANFSEDLVNRKLEEHNIKDAVLFTGVRGDVNRLLQAMDVFILPSNYEGLGIVAIEAQNAGLPTFCSDPVPREAGITDLCRFLPLNAPAQWADAILACSVPTENERSQAPAAVRAAGYDISETTAELQAFYLRIANENGFI